MEHQTNIAMDWNRIEEAIGVGAFWLLVIVFFGGLLIHAFLRLGWLITI